jgi:ABC-2 type transport system ATP-binding protein
VVIATHDMDEAQQLCDQVLIIHHGKRVAAGTPDELMRQAALAPVVHVRLGRAIERGQLESIPSIAELDWHDDHGSFRAAEPANALVELVRRCQMHGVELLSLELRQPTLADAFLKLAGDR